MAAFTDCVLVLSLISIPLLSISHNFFAQAQDFSGVTGFASDPSSNDYASSNYYPSWNNWNNDDRDDNGFRSGSGFGSIIQVGRYSIRSTKAGSCPAQNAVLQNRNNCGRPRCLSDHACPGSQKCCAYGGCPQCQQPVRHHGNNNNNMNGNMQWVFNNQNSNNSFGGTKAGTCPVISLGNNCASNCQTDYSCSGPQKCCSNGCGLVCLYPQTFTGSGGAPLFKAGSCPVSTGPAGSCIAGCSMLNGDGDCSGTSKCCSNGCGTECMNAAGLPSAVTGPPAGVVDFCRVVDF
ncbi:hypothetical protein BV898_09414 [Hypsibius exemplaris]|uniref:WAP domain-containing protein n=1 Tax=Hypsibius exemplaris TaxID=2072580 RepID=A0A1W0WMS3_HYPEX|nr:hypothetical protein BV898_09414 [Hypsibius exemplaris]